MEIMIWGAGAVGLGLASTLARPGERLGVIARQPETRSQVASHGLRRTGRFGEIRVPTTQLTVVDSPEALVDRPPDWLLVCTKAFSSADIARALEPLASRLAKRSRLLLCQNGWGNEQSFLPFWPKERLFHARIITGFHRRSAGVVEVTAHAAPIAMGSLFGADTDCLEPLAERLTLGGIPAETTSDMRGVLWAKMLYNCALNPLGAISGRRYGELVENPTTRALLEEIVHEVFAVLSAANIEVAWTSPVDYLATFYEELIPPTADHESSMLQDLRAGRPTEIEALAGAVEHLGRENGITTPVISALAQLIRAAEN
jgi:2-dehydropantoate 2-reductase